jgi:nucleoid-associated protein YgaU
MPAGLSGLDAVLDAAAELKIDSFRIEKEHGRMVIRGVARYQLDREQLFEAVKHLDGWASEVVVDITVSCSDIRGYHTVRRGETLATIAKRYFGNAAKERAIFEANRDRMNDPGQIFVGQQLLIPWR